MNYQGQVSRWVTSGFRKFRYERAYYYCRHCHLGQAPLDQQLDLCLVSLLAV
jgi:hypothetical protein